MMVDILGVFVCHTLILLLWFKVYARTKSKIVGGAFLAFDGAYNALWASLVFFELPKNEANTILGFNSFIFETLSERIKRYQGGLGWRGKASRPIYRLIDKIDPGHFDEI